MSYLAHIQECNAFDPTLYRPFRAGGKRVGMVRKELALRLAAFTEIFRVEDDEVRLLDSYATPEARTRAMALAAAKLVEAGILPKLRHEMYAVAEEWGQTEVMRIDRAAVAAFGIKAAGVHLNGFVGRGPKTRVWIAKRSLDKAVAPGKLDHLVAGGQPAGLGLMENLIKECAEEANIPENLALQSAPVGMVSYQMDYAQGLRHDRLFCYDLELPVDFIPHPADGEVESFMLWPIEQVMETVLKTRDFKFNVALVLIDFLVRHGHITPDGEPDYLEIVKGLRGA